MRRGAVADLLPVLAVEEGHFITVDGRIGAALACTGINLAIQSDEAAATVAALFAETLTYLPLGAHLELLVTNRPLRADEWVPRHRAQFRAPVGLAAYIEGLADAYRHELGGQHIPDLRFYAILSLPGATERRRPRRHRILGTDRAAHRGALAGLTLAASELAHALAELEIVATPLGRQGLLDLLWQCANPTWSQDVVAPYREASPADVRTLRDRLGQSRLVRRADMLCLDRGYETTMALRALPDGTFPGWLRALMATGVAFRFAVHIEPLAKEKERTALTRTLRQRHAVLAERRYQGSSPDIEQEEAYGEAQDLLRQMSTTDLRTFRTVLFVTVRAGTPTDLSAAARAVGKALGDAGGTAIDRCQLYQDVVWQATLPLARNPAGMTYRTVTTNLADTLPFLHHRAGTRAGVLIGFSHPGHEVVTLDMYDPALDNSNLTCLGISGSGKTMFAQSFALKHIAKGGRVIVLDRSTGHWDDLVAAVPGAVVHRVLLDSGFRINPWELPRHVNEPSQTKLEYLLDLHTLLVGELHGGTPALTAQERALLEGACRAVYREKRQPFERHLFEWLRRAEDSEARDGDPLRQQYRALAERLVPYVDGGTYAGLLDGPTTVRPDALLEVFNFKGLADRLVPLAMLPLIEYIWAVIADPTRPTLVVLDEGWSLLNNPASARFVAEATRTGRHHGIITLNLSQMVTDYEGPLGRAVIDNASVSLLLAQSDHALPKVQEVFHLSADERAMVGRLRTVRQVRAGAYLHSRRGADSGEISLYVTPEEYWLFTSVPAERKLRQAAIARHGGDVWAAVRALARGAALRDRRGRCRAGAPRGGRRMKLAVGALVAVLLVPLLLLAVAAAGVAALARTLDPLGHLPGLPGSGPLGPVRPGGRPGLLRGHGEPVRRGRRHRPGIDPRPRLRPLGRRAHRAPHRRDQSREPARRPGGGDPPSRAAVRRGPAPDRPVATGERHGHGRDQQPRQRRQHALGRRQAVRGAVRLHARAVDDGPSVGGLSECRARVSASGSTTSASSTARPPTSPTTRASTTRAATRAMSAHRAATPTPRLLLDLVRQHAGPPVAPLVPAPGKPDPETGDCVPRLPVTSATESLTPAAGVAGDHGRRLRRAKASRSRRDTASRPWAANPPSLAIPTSTPASTGARRWTPRSTPPPPRSPSRARTAGR